MTPREHYATAEQILIKAQALAHAVIGTYQDGDTTRLVTGYLEDDEVAPTMEAITALAAIAHAHATLATHHSEE